jgi:hypothetical protein
MYKSPRTELCITIILITVKIEIAEQTDKEIHSKLLLSSTMNSFNILDEIHSHLVLCGLGLFVCYVSRYYLWYSGCCYAHKISVACWRSYLQSTFSPVGEISWTPSCKDLFDSKSLLCDHRGSTYMDMATASSLWFDPHCPSALLALQSLSLTS